MMRGWLVVLSLLLLAASARAQAEPDELPAPTAEPPPLATTPTPPPPAIEPPVAPTAAPRPLGAPVVHVDRSTPRQTVSGFLHAVAQNDLGRATQYLELRGVQWKSQTPQEAAQQLAAVLQRRVWLQLAAISDHPAGTADDGAEVERIATVEVGGRPVPITLVRTRRGADDVWLFSATTVAQIPDLAEALGTSSWVLELVPDHLENRRFAGLWLWQWIGLVVAFLFGLPLGYLIARFVLAFLLRFAHRTPARWDEALVFAARGPVRFSLTWIAMGLIALSLDLPPSIDRPLRLFVTTPLIVATGWFLVRVIRVSTAEYLQNVPDDQEINTRGLRTQIVILRKIGSVTVGLITFAIALMQFDVVRSVGWSLLASAGVAGVAIGFAAQKSLGAVVAGLQLSITQPIRLGDAVIIQGEWGVVEEITITYVRLQLWDERRLIVPIDKFLTEAFENWSKPGNSMIGIIEIAVDPTAPIALLRSELERLAAEHPAHDGRVCLLQLIDLSERRALLRARVSTSQVDKTFAMRCDIRESLMDFLQKLERGRYLARSRYERVVAQPGQ
jgi:small-conductance mechanosensitive channel